MAETNGAVKLGKTKRGIIKFEFDEGEVFEVDVVKTYDRWWGVNWELRDKDGRLEPKNFAKHGENRRQLAQEIIADAFAKLGKTPPEIDQAAAEAFIAAIEEKVEELRNFTLPKKEEPSSSPTSSAAAPEAETKEVFSQ